MSVAVKSNGEKAAAKSSQLIKKSDKCSGRNLTNRGGEGVGKANTLSLLIRGKKNKGGVCVAC